MTNFQFTVLFAGWVVSFLGGCWVGWKARKARTR